MVGTHPVAAAAAGVAAQHGDVHRAHEVGIRLQREVGAGQLEQLGGDLGHGDVAPEQTL